VGAILGGMIGGRLAGLVRPTTLRTLVIAIGIGVALIFFLR
jgi:uncharacterized membrane protein YfcA